MIFFVDDEKRWMNGYIEDIEIEGYEFKYFIGVDKAYNYLIKYQAETDDIVVLDIMMPPGETYKKRERKNGIDTGIHFYEDIKSINPNLKIIILTNRNRIDCESYFKLKNTWFREKKELSPSQLVVLIKSINRE